VTGPHPSGWGRVLRPGLLLAVLFAGAGGLVGVSGRTWAQGASTVDPVTGLAVHTSLAGTAVAPAVRPVALALLAGSAALLLVRGRSRIALAGLLAVLALAAGILAIRAGADARATAWAVTAGVLALLCTLAAAALAVVSRAWAQPAPRRFEAPGAEHPVSETDAWTALDRGEDPTA
jgi:Tryptophan-associated transmembrane protein (Trp_oprn_chp)